MAEMEKEGRPPENKRSRKPAHPVKREINEEMKVKKRGAGVVVVVVVGSVPSCMSLRVETVVVKARACLLQEICHTLRSNWLHDGRSLI